MNTRRILPWILIAAFALSACSAQRTSTESTMPPGAGGGATGYAITDATGPSVEPVPAVDQGAKGAEGRATTTNAAASADRLVIRTANLSLVVTSPAEAADRIASLANSLNGFVVSSYVSQASVDAAGNKIMQANITVRVPTAQLDAALAQIRGLAVELKTENVSGQDVTAEFTDLNSQLTNLEAAEKQLQKIMDGATKTEDVLAVFNQLTYIRQQIEQVKGQMKYYSESAAMSAITVELIPDELAQPLQVGGWRPQGVVKEAVEALVRAVQTLTTAVIWLGIYVLPLGLLVGLPIYFLLRLLVRRVRRPAAKPAA